MATLNILRVLAALALMSVFAGAAAQTQPSDAVRVYDSTEIAYDRYTVVRRLGVEGAGSAFRIPGHRDLESARQALIREAAGLGADGVINLTCFDQTDRIFRPAGFYCYGNAIRLKNETRVRG